MNTLSLIKPSIASLGTVLEGDSLLPFSYEQVGGTRSGVPSPGWTTAEERRVIGHGEADFQAAVVALRRWVPFDLAWVFAVRSDVPLEPGEHFAFLSRTLGIWSVNVCRIVYTEDEQDDQSARFGFAYGTLEMHAVRGEERFLVEWDKATDEVFFGVRKFSQPASALLRVFGPVTRWLQDHFTNQAIDRMAAAVVDA
ncbi:MAG: DUF1990 family protein [Rhodobacterales bacterium]|nr:DUF1990 family protein [Rhodobacterales bacterium]